MKRARTVLAIVAVATLLICSETFAAESAVMAFDPISQIMYTVVRSDEPIPYCVDVQYSQSHSGGVIGEPVTFCIGLYELWAEVPLNPGSMAPGDTNAIVASVTLADPACGAVRATVEAHDTLVSSESGYVYCPAPCVNPCLPIVPDSIRIGSETCAYICHGSYVIPITCEDPGYTPGLLEVYVENGCAPLETHCDSSACPQVNWDVFRWYKRVLSGCRLYLVMTYCDSWPGCVCIWRSDFYLPVEMVDFAAVPGNGRITLNWATASETSTEKFIIVRAESRDGVYRTVAELDAHGTTSIRHDYSWADEQVANGYTYYYKLHAQDVDGASHVYNRDGEVVVVSATPSENAGMPLAYRLEQNYPNPFNSQTTFGFTIAAAGHVSLKVFDLLGREVATVVDGDLAADRYSVTWSADGLPTGVYMYTLTSGGFTKTHKLLYLK